MGRKSLKKDRAYITATEWKNEWGGAKDRTRLAYSRLPFHCCGISFTPFEDSVCTEEGTVFEVTNIVPYIQRHHRHPVTGEPLELKSLIRLHWAKNSDGEYHCPILNKVFTEHTHIVAIKTTGNVYSWEAVEQLNIKPKYWKDLLTDAPFTRKDIIHIQDPLNLSGRNVSEFHHVKTKLSSRDGDADASEDPLAGLNTSNLGEDAQRILAKLNTEESAKAFAAGGGGKKVEALRLLAEAQLAQRDAKGGAKAKEAPKEGPDPRLQAPTREPVLPVFKPGASTWNTDDPSQAPPWVRAKMQKEIEAGRWRGQDPKGEKVPEAKKPVPKPYGWGQFVEDKMRTTGAASRAFTSTVAPVATKNERTMVRVERNPKKKAYMQLHTTLGNLNLELHADIAPRTVENFLLLSEEGYYKDTIFHRCIKHFMIQGGDPSGTGTGGESVYGPTFKDELDSRLLHTGRGVLSMANSGPNTNGSQFFILFKSAHHLDFKHTVFGNVVGGFETLTAMEKAETDSEDRPLTEIRVTGATVFVNPYKEEMEAEQKKAEEERLKVEKLSRPPAEEDMVGSWFSNPAGPQGVSGDSGGSGVGKYLASVVPKVKAVEDPTGQPQPKKAKAATTYGNFDVW
eukprot:jgi/Botrbrau1/8425/Bobra.0237s0045.1